MDLVLGRFDNQTASGQINPDLQAAAVLQDQAAHWVVFYDLVGDAGYSISANTVYTVTAPPTGGLSLLPVLAAGDLQGRSLLLGAPAKIVENGYSSPSTVVGMPPMHIDWAVPSCADPNYPNNCTAPNVVNILVKPASNYAQFNTQVKQSSQSSSQPTTSYGFATEDSFGLNTSFGIPDLLSVGVDVAYSGQQVYNSSISPRPPRMNRRSLTPRYGRGLPTTSGLATTGLTSGHTPLSVRLPARCQSPTACRWSGCRCISKSLARIR